MFFVHHIIVFQVSGAFNFRPEHTQIQAKSQNVQDIGMHILHCPFYIILESPVFRGEIKEKRINHERH